MSPARPPPSDTDRILGAIRDTARKVDALADRMTRGEARTDEGVKQTAELGARLETLANDFAAAEQRARNTREQMLAQNTNAWRSLDRKLDGAATNEGLTAASLHERLQAMEREVATIPPVTAETVDAKGKRTRKWVLGGSLVGAGGGLVVILDNLPKAAKVLHAAWKGMGAAGTDLIR